MACFRISEIPFLRIVGLSFGSLLFRQLLYGHRTCKVQNHVAKLVWMLVCTAPCTSPCYDVFHRTLAERQISYPSPKPLEKRFACNWITKITEIRLSASLRCRWKLTFRHRASYIQDRRFAALQTTLFIYLINIIMHPRCCRPVADNIVGALYHKL